ncbi:substrate-binding periplasmic protein [Aliikangiella coralliicola]|uniref:Amino acid ABC transporter substrate-binding protein n=1 Tax=Aliikangiella coralliicola TaxID=2592383 RepID=A0A545UIF0_9GAMM|nr:transporter substrate-binding domain-containing protein [Aliikangiella coralliicola]TQV89235.1 amino acid ABC transporter substrate-binding protein [Aliikangiella coralliicola]
MKRKLLFGLLSCFVLVLAGCGEAPEPKKPQVKKEAAKPSIIAAKCQLNMGWDPWEPYQYLTPDDKVQGLEIDLVSAMAKEAGCDLNFVQKNWMNLLNGIRNGSIDMLGGASRTTAREKFAHFSDNYRHESFILYVRKGESGKYSELNLKQLLDGDFRLGVTQDYIYGEQVSELQDNESYQGKFVSVPTTEVNYYNLVQNQIDGFLEDPFVAAYTIKRKGLQDDIEQHPLEVHSGDVAIMFSKKSVKQETVDAFNKALAKLKQNGEYQKILAKYSH